MMFPGILLSALLAFIATLIQDIPVWPFTLSNGTHPIESVLIAIVLGILVGNSVAVPEKWKVGLNFSAKTVLSTAIVLLGASLNVADIFQLSGYFFIILLVSILLVFIVTILLGCLLGTSTKTTMLIAIGTAICGSSAIATAAPVIDANQDEVAVSITIINMLGLIAIFLFPMIGHLVAFSPNSFGVWAGISIQAVPQVVAAGFGYSLLSGKIATIVKLVRVLFLAPSIFMLKFWSIRQQRGNSSQLISPTSWQQYVPPFILLFILMIGLRSFGIIHNFHMFGSELPVLSTLSTVASFLMSMALAAIGLNTRIKQIFSAGLRVFLLGLLAAVFLAMFSGFFVY